VEFIFLITCCHFHRYYCEFFSDVLLQLGDSLRAIDVRLVLELSPKGSRQLRRSRRPLNIPIFWEHLQRNVIEFLAVWAVDPSCWNHKTAPRWHFLSVATWCSSYYNAFIIQRRSDQSPQWTPQRVTQSPFHCSEVVGVAGGDFLAFRRAPPYRKHKVSVSPHQLRSQQVLKFG
jgi:hypothetical protein